MSVMPPDPNPHEPSAPFATSAMASAARAMLREYDPRLVARGRAYAEQGRVTGFASSGTTVMASVSGTDKYVVTLELVPGLRILDCTCPAFAREDACKHVAAVAFVLAGADHAGGGQRAMAPARADRFPDCLAHASTDVLGRLSLYARQRVDVPQLWMGLTQFWGLARKRSDLRLTALKDRVVAFAPEIERTFEELRAWEPPEPPEVGTELGALYGRLVRTYRETRGRAEIWRTLPGPLDERHPGFSFSYDVERRRFEAAERSSPLLAAPKHLSIGIPLDPAEPPAMGESFRSYGLTDAWDLFALRAVLLAIVAGEDEGVLALRDDLRRPAWDRLLSRLASSSASPQRAPSCASEWAFVLSPTYANRLGLFVFAREVRPDRRPLKWKKDRYERLLEQDASPLERDIARAALLRAERVGVALVELGTPHAHELLRLLSRHPRVTFAEDKSPDPDADPRAQISVGTLTMQLETGPKGNISPRFVLGETELEARELRSIERSGFRGIVDEPLVASAFVPPPLRPWIEMAAAMGDRLTFPPEAIPKLVATTEPLVAAGIVELPRQALGEKLPYTPRPALRVEWLPEGAALVEVLVSVHPSAPLIDAGLGPALYTFEERGRRVYVERDPDVERRLVRETEREIAAPLVWSMGVGRTESVDDALALAKYLDDNPLGLTVEVKLGRSPQAVTWTDAHPRLVVRKAGAWLVLDGEISVGRDKLTLGEVLEAARHARRYVRAGEGTFLELSQKAREKLAPIAAAIDLGDVDGGRMHEAFGAVLAGAAELFETVRGPDLSAYAERLEASKTPVVVPPLDRGELRDYQREGAAWMLRLAQWAPGCVLADDMGLGKTVQTAAVLKARAALGPALIVAPASVSSNWVAELERFVPSLRIRWFNEDRALATSSLGPGDVVVISYGLLSREAPLFRERAWATVVLDEAQYVKNLAAQRREAAGALARGFTIALTGTPLENNLGELFSIVDLAFPGLLGEESIFRERFRKPIETRRDVGRLAALSRIIEPFLLRRTRKAVLAELPAREEITERVELSPEEQRRYLALRRACELQFARRKRDKKEMPAGLRIELLAALTRLRQMACDVSLVDPTFEGASTKIARAVEIARELAAEGNRALVFSQFTQFLAKVRAALEEAGLRVAYLTGETPTSRRREIVERFQEGQHDVFCVSLLAGGTGLNLTRASYVIHLDPWWNPAAEEQATSRAHRMGQTEPVTVIRLVSRGTIEEAVLSLHASKRDLAEAVLEGKGIAKSMSSAELLALLSS
jgi:superfamily II DNA or RNA helicase